VPCGVLRGRAGFGGGDVLADLFGDGDAVADRPMADEEELPAGHVDVDPGGAIGAI